MLFFSASGQEKDFTFLINGNINCKQGKVKLFPALPERYYPSNSLFEPVEIKDGKFVIKGVCRYPLALMLRVDSAGDPVYMSDVFFVTPGVQSIQCNIDSVFETPIILNSAMEEYLGKYKKHILQVEETKKQLNKIKDSINGVFNINLADTVLTRLVTKNASLSVVINENSYQYVKANSKSFVALWMLAKRLEQRYMPIFDSVYEWFAAPLKSTPTGQAIQKQLASSKLVGIGTLFPTIFVLDTLNKRYSLSSKTHFKYTLIDFWHSRCSPCISQFPHLTNLYNSYHQKGFEILGISVDSQKQVPAWKAVMKKHNLPWKQYLDESGKLAAEFGISNYPSNFLLDEKGTVVAVDISMNELELRLRKGL